MLTYTFSKREKALLVVLAVILIVVAWYEFIFVRCQDQIQQLDSQIADVQDEMTVDSAKAQQLQPMRDALARYQQEGIEPSPVPDYDNTKALMAELDDKLKDTTVYMLSFDDVDTGDGSVGTVASRGCTMSFGCSSYEQGRDVLLSLAHGDYSCSIDSFDITDDVATAATTTSGIVGSNGSGGDNCSVSAHVTFYEKIPAATTGTDSGSSDGSGSESSATQLGNSFGMVNAGRGTGQQALTEGTGSGNGSTAGSNAAGSSN